MRAVEAEQVVMQRGDPVECGGVAGASASGAVPGAGVGEWRRVGDGRRRLWRRAGQLVLGLALWGLASTLLIRAELGLGPWDAFHVGLHRLTGLSVGLATIVTGLAIVGVTLMLRVRPGVATIANMVLLGVFVDLLLPVVPVAGGWLLAAAYFAAGVVLAGAATGLYIGAGFGQGPRDALMVALHERTGWSVSRARTVLEGAALAVGWAMGGRVGVGTVLFALTIGPAVQWGLRRFAAPAALALAEGDVPSGGSSGPLRQAA